MYRNYDSDDVAEIIANDFLQFYLWLSKITPEKQ